MVSKKLNTIKALSAIILLIGSIGMTAFCQESTGDTQPHKSKANFRFVPFVAPAYTPELRLLISTGGLMTFKTNPQDEKIQRSSIPFSIGVSTSGAVIAAAIVTSFWFEDRLRIYADFWYKDMPDNYWGVGYDAGRNTPKGDSTTSFERQWWWINPRILWRLRTNLYGGLNLDLNQTKARDVSEGMANDPVFQKFGNNNYNGGMGLILQYDSRDVPVNAYRGLFLSGMFTIFGSYLGSDNTYQIYDIDYRQYQTIGRPGSRLAWQVNARIGEGDVPYGDMSQLGTPFDLRGYIWGQYRDRTMLFGILEYRHKFLKNTHNAFGNLESRHGVVGWVGAGSVGEDIVDLNKWLPNGGVGYRFEVQPRMNLRFDVGFGIDATRFYVNFNEAF
jgi:hypothetical protein